MNIWNNEKTLISYFESIIQIFKLDSGLRLGRNTLLRFDVRRVRKSQKGNFKNGQSFKNDQDVEHNNITLLSAL